MLYREQTFAPCAFHSELQQQTNTVNSLSPQGSPPSGGALVPRALPPLAEP